MLKVIILKILQICADDRRRTLIPVHTHLLLLADSVRPIHSLKIHLRIPIRIVNYNDISRCQIDTQSTGSR